LIGKPAGKGGGGEGEGGVILGGFVTEYYWR